MLEPGAQTAAQPHDTWRSFWVYTPILVCILIMLPRLLSPQFGMMDDGRSLQVADGIVHGKWDLNWDLHAGRLRPVYWAAFAFWYSIAGEQSFWYFLGNLAVFSATTFFIIRLVLDLGGSRQQAWASGLFFALGPPVIENVYTLSKAENLQVLLLVTAVWLGVKAAKAGQGRHGWVFLIASTLLILAACLTKENTLVMVPVSLAWWLIARIGRKRGTQPASMAEMISLRVVIASLVGGGIFYLARTVVISAKIFGVGQYAEFNFGLSNLLDSLVRWGGWLVRDYTWLGFLIVAAIIVDLARRRWPHPGLWPYALVWMAVWLGLYLPWYFAVEYYLLPFSAGAAIFAGTLVGELADLTQNPSRAWRVTGGITLAITGLLLLITQANSIADAKVQLAQDAVNDGVVAYLARNAPQKSAVLVNIQLSNEYLEQMELLLVNEYHRTDLNFDKYQGQDLNKIVAENPAVFVLVAGMQNQPRMTVRMGFIQESLEIWNSILQPKLESWGKAYQYGRDAPLVLVDFPRLLCPVIYREAYCSPGGRLVSYQIFHYQWTVYTPK